jgi:hypothetical protein
MSTRWVSWRRDLLFALACVLVASAVLVSIGGQQVRAECRHAEAAEQENARHQGNAENQTRATRQENEHAAEREKATHALDEEYRLLLERYMQNDLKGEDSGPRRHELSIERERARELERKQVQELLRKYRQK